MSLNLPFISRIPREVLTNPSHLKVMAKSEAEAAMAAFLKKP
jgi:hypothetical protein